MASRADLLSIVDADPDLAELLDANERERARRQAVTGVRNLPVGDWDAANAHGPQGHQQGFLLIDGLIAREVEVLDRQCVELLGAGDVLRPWGWDPSGSHVQAEVGWRVLEPTRLAVLDHNLVVRMTPWPQLGLELFARGTRRAHSLAIVLAIAHYQRVSVRLKLTLWYLAERWGRVRSDGILIPLPLPHQRLADVIGAHRPSVTTAIGQLTRSGDISRTDNGEWVLHGTAPTELHQDLPEKPVL